MKVLKVFFDKQNRLFDVEGKTQETLIIEKPLKVEFRKEGNNGYAYITLYDWQ